MPFVFHASICISLARQQHLCSTNTQFCCPTSDLLFPLPEEKRLLALFRHHTELSITLIVAPQFMFQVDFSLVVSPLWPCLLWYMPGEVSTLQIATTFQPLTQTGNDIVLIGLRHDDLGAESLACFYNLASEQTFVYRLNICTYACTKMMVASHLRPIAILPNCCSICIELIEGFKFPTNESPLLPMNVTCMH